MVYVAGSNIFGQWPCCTHVKNKFHAIRASKHDLDIPSKRTKLLQINWSYNILQIADEFYISGAWDGKEHQLAKIALPDEYTGSNDDLIVVGNDYNVLLVSKNENTVWVMDLMMQKEIKKITFSIEEPIENVEKRQKKDHTIRKVAFVNNCCLYLSSVGNVYCGILPSYVETRHCRGTIRDVQCGYEHYIVLTDTGVVYTWGDGRRLQLGHGDISSLEMPTEVEALAGIKITKIRAGGWHTLALSEFGDLYAWGWNDTGQLGIKHDKDEEKKSYPVPTLVDLFDSEGKEVTINIKDIACGSRHSAILLEDNTVWTSGLNNYGQLGISEKQYPTVSYFKNVFHCDKSCTLMCGPWTTVLISSQDNN